MQDKFGVNLYDSQARFQSNTGAFLSIDPMAEKYYSISPYAYCAGNPINLVDPEGMDWFFNSETGELIRNVKNGSDYIVLLSPDQISENMSDEDLLKLVNVFDDNDNKSNLFSNSINSISKVVAKKYFQPSGIWQTRLAKPIQRQ